MNTIDCRASTRPRMVGAALICTIAVDAVMKVMLVKPMTTPAGKASHRVGAAASSSIPTPKAAAERTTSSTVRSARLAATSGSFGEKTL